MRPRHTWRLVVVLLGATAVLLGATSCADESTLHRFVIPDGTQERLAAGETVTLMPAELRVHVGDRIHIVNEDAFTQSIGPYRVGPGETLTQTFTTKGELVGECLLSEGGEFRIVVEP